MCEARISEIEFRAYTIRRKSRGAFNPRVVPGVRTYLQEHEKLLFGYHAFLELFRDNRRNVAMYSMLTTVERRNASILGCCALFTLLRHGKQLDQRISLVRDLAHPPHDWRAEMQTGRGAVDALDDRQRRPAP